MQESLFLPQRRNPLVLRSDALVNALGTVYKQKSITTRRNEGNIPHS